MTESGHQPAEHWDNRYSESPRIWSGRVNAALVKTAAALTPGTAVDLGSGEGADVIWLADQGWRATGLDISSVAVQRAQTAAAEHGLTPDQVDFIAADLLDWQPAALYDLVTSAFMHSSGPFDRQGALRKARDFVAPGGYLLVISHATTPPWAKARHKHDHDEHHQHDETSPDSELELLALAPDSWTVERAELFTREATGPDGQQATLTDTIILARRTA